MTKYGTQVCLKILSCERCNSRCNRYLSHVEIVVDTIYYDIRRVTIRAHSPKGIESDKVDDGTVWVPSMPPPEVEA